MQKLNFLGEQCVQVILCVYEQCINSSKCALTSQDFLRTIMDFQLNSIHLFNTCVSELSSSLIFHYFGVGNISKSRYSFLKSNTFFKDAAIIKIVIQMACSYKVYFN